MNYDVSIEVRKWAVDLIVTSLLTTLKNTPDVSVEIKTETVISEAKKLEDYVLGTKDSTVS